MILRSSELSVVWYTKHFTLLRNPSIFKIKACLEMLNVLSFLGNVWWIFKVSKISYCKHDNFGDMVWYKGWSVAINRFYCFFSVLYEFVMILK